MTSRNWKDTAELVGMAAIVMSLVFVGFQLKLDRAVSVVDARAALANRAIYLTEIVNENADIWIRGLDGEELTLADEARFLGLYRAVETHFHTAYLRYSRVGPIDPNGSAKEFAYALYAHPGLRRIDQVYRTLRQDQLTALNVIREVDFAPLVDNYLQELDETKPSPNRQYFFW